MFDYSSDMKSWTHKKKNPKENQIKSETKRELTVSTELIENQ